MLYYLLTPVIQLIVGFSFVMAVAIALVADLPFWASGWPMLAFYLTLSFGPAVLALINRGGGRPAAIVALMFVLPYTIYSWMLFPVLLRALFRFATGRSGWAKTAREPLAPAAEVATGEQN